MGKQYSSWTFNEKRGKGSHALMTKEGERPFPVPQKISSGVHDMIKKRLGIKD